MWFYRMSGLDVASAIELPIATRLLAPPSPPDVSIRRGSVPSELPGATVHGPNWLMSGDRLVLHVPNIARFLIMSGQDILVDSLPGADEREAITFLLGSAFGILLHQRGHLVLHGSAVAVGDKAVLFCGASGAGKSTLAAALVKQGFPLVSDDICNISFTSLGEPILHPDSRMLTLWADTMKELSLEEAKGDAVRSGFEKYYVSSPGESVINPRPLGAIYALSKTNPATTSGIKQQNIVDGMIALKKNAYRPLLLSYMGSKDAHFVASARIQGRAGLFTLTRPIDFKFMPDVIRWLEDHWKSLGLIEGK